MIIRRYSCKRFAGLRDTAIDFAPNLNVILGPNEAGKSTIVEGIYATLFKSIKLGNRTKEDKNFRHKFMPLAGGDSIDGQLTVANGMGEYEISKEWGSQPSFQLTTPDSRVLKDENNINIVLQDLLLFGEGTYSSIVFTKQQHINSAIERIIENREATSEVGSLLRKAVMELDGVSLDGLDQKIHEEIHRSLKRWDVERNCPENNRGIANPYKVGYGEVLDSFYRKENLRLAMNDAVKAEEELEKAYQELQQTETKITALKANKEAMEEIEEDVLQRAVLEPQGKQFVKDMTALTEVNREWPQKELRIKQLEEEIAALNKTSSKLQGDKVLAGKVAEKEALEKRLEDINGLKHSLANTEKQLRGMQRITREDIQNLEAHQRTMLTAQAKMQAGVMLGKLNFLQAGTELLVTSDLGEPAQIALGEEFNANGYLQITGKNLKQDETLFQVELKSGDIDFKDLRQQYANAKTQSNRLFQSLGVESIEAAKLHQEQLDKLAGEMEGYRGKISQLLEEDTLDELKEKLESFGDLSQVKPLAEIEEEINAISAKSIEAIAEKNTLEGTVAKWSQEYETVEGLLDKIIEVRTGQKEVQDKLDKLAPLPEAYASSDAFRRILSETRLNFEAVRNSQAELRETYFECERNLPEQTYEELSTMFQDEEALFQKKLKHGKNLLKIKEVFQATRAKMDVSSFTPVIKSFSKYLGKITQDAYHVSDVNDEFNLTLVRDEQLEMPVNLLSSGTYDTVALALRLGILENILDDNQGFVVLDDCLVDLDPYRKEKAVEIIREFANQHQVIFVTCNPDTAAMLQGKLIKM